MNLSDALKDYLSCLANKEDITLKNANTFVQGAKAAINALESKIANVPPTSKLYPRLAAFKAKLETVVGKAESLQENSVLNEGLEPGADGKKVKRL